MIRARTRSCRSSGCSSSVQSSWGDPSIPHSRAPSPLRGSDTTARAGPGARPASPAPAATRGPQPGSPRGPRRLTPGSWPWRPPAALSGHLCTQVAGAAQQTLRRLDAGGRPSQSEWRMLAGVFGSTRPPRTRRGERASAVPQGRRRSLRVALAQMEVSK